MSFTKKINEISKRRFQELYWFQQNIRKRIRFKRIAKRYRKTYGEMDVLIQNKEYIQKIRNFLSEYFKGYTDINWHLYYASFNNILSDKYIPDSIYFTTLESTLNKFELSKAYSDKNSYDNFIEIKDLPKTIYKLVNGEFFDSENIKTPHDKVYRILEHYEKEVVFKPAIMSGMGRNVIIDTPKNFISILNSKDYRKASYIIQEKIEQHPEMAKFHPSSVNTCRIMTARIESEIVILSAYFRVGRNKTRVDNGMAGGIMCGINPKGKITDFAFDLSREKIYKHPDTLEKFEGFIIPDYNKATDLCKRYHKKLLHFTLVSWDIAIDQHKNPICIELNLNRQAIIGHQLVNGPLFGEHSDYFLDQYKKDYKKNFFYQ